MQFLAGCSQWFEHFLRFFATNKAFMLEKTPSTTHRQQPYAMEWSKLGLALLQQARIDGDKLLYVP